VNHLLVGIVNRIAVFSLEEFGGLY